MDRKNIFEGFAREDEVQPSEMPPSQAGWWRIGLDPDRALAHHRFALTQALRASLAELGANNLERELRATYLSHKTEDAEEKLVDLVERLLPSDKLAARRRAAEASSDGDEAYTDEVLEPGNILSDARAAGLAWGLTPDETTWLVAGPSAGGFISNRSRTRAVLVLRIARLLQMADGDKTGFAKAFLTTRDERFDFVPLQSLSACSTDRLRLIWRALHLRVYGREP